MIVFLIGSVKWVEIAWLKNICEIVKVIHKKTIYKEARYDCQKFYYKLHE